MVHSAFQFRKWYRSNPIVLTLTFLVAFSVTASRSTFAFELTPETERIMKLSLNDGTSLDEGYLAHRSLAFWYLPLGALSDELGFAIQVSPGLSRAEGFFISEERTFKLDLNQCEVQIENKNDRYPCDEVVLFEQDIYVQKTLLEKWFPLEIEIDPFRSEVVVSPLEPLPVQRMRKRDQMYIEKKAFQVPDPGFPRKPIERSPLAGPFLDQQLSLIYQKSNGSDSSSFRHDTSLTGQVLGMDALTYLGGNDTFLDRYRVTFSQRSPHGMIFGPYINAKDVQVLDINMPPIHLISQGGLGRGFYISNRPLYFPTNFFNQDFTGILLPGWEVQIFRNYVLIDRKVSDGSGQYLFTGVPLLYGQNEFLLSFYGPQGQRREERRIIWVGSDLVQPSQSFYRFAISGMGGVKQRILFDYNKSLFPKVTLNTGYAYMPLPGQTEFTHFGTVGFNALVSTFLTSGYVGLSTKGGKIGQLGVQTGVLGANLTTRYSRLFDYQSEVFNANSRQSLVDRQEVDLAFVMRFKKSISMNFEYQRDHFSDGTEINSLIHRLSTQTGNIYWNTDLTYRFNQIDPLIGKLSPFLLTPYGQFRLEADCTTSAITSVYAEWLQTLTDRSVYRVGLRRRLTLNQNEVLLSLSSPVSNLFMGTLNFEYSDVQNFSTSLFVSYSLANDSSQGQVHLGPYPQAEFGAISVLVFLDENRNGKWDSTEPLLPNIEIKVQQKANKFISNKKGRIFVPNLLAYAPVDVSVSLMSLDDPSWRPGKAGERVYPPPGKVAQVYMPIVATGEVDGVIGLDSSLQVEQRLSLRGIRLYLTHENGTKRAETFADRDGFFLFDDLAPGIYQLSVDESRLPARLKAVPSSYSIEIKDEGGFVSAQDFVIQNR